jgi:hypothetical protein
VLEIGIEWAEVVPTKGPEGIGRDSDAIGARVHLCIHDIFSFDEEWRRTGTGCPGNRKEVATIHGRSIEENGNNVKRFYGGNPREELFLYSLSGTWHWQ